jgi:hypothetical protein
MTSSSSQEPYLPCCSIQANLGVALTTVLEYRGRTNTKQPPAGRPSNPPRPTDYTKLSMLAKMCRNLHIHNGKAELEGVKYILRQAQRPDGSIRLAEDMTLNAVMRCAQNSPMRWRPHCC